MEKRRITRAENIQVLGSGALKRHMNTRPEQRRAPGKTAVVIDDAIVRTVRSVIRTASWKEAIGVEEIFVERVNVQPENIGQIVCDFWAKCKEMKRILRDWAEKNLCQYLKKGSTPEMLLADSLRSCHTCKGRSSRQ